MLLQWGSRRVNRSERGNYTWKHERVNSFVFDTSNSCQTRNACTWNSRGILKLHCLKLGREKKKEFNTGLYNSILDVEWVRLINLEKISNTYGELRRICSKIQWRHKRISPQEWRIHLFQNYFLQDACRAWILLFCG